MNSLSLGIKRQTGRSKETGSFIVRDSSDERSTENGLTIKTNLSEFVDYIAFVYKVLQKQLWLFLINYSVIASRRRLAAKQSHRLFPMDIGCEIASSGKAPSSQ
jgi:hypothetical protein